MESINVVIDDEIRTHSKGEISQSTLETLPSPTGNVSENSSAAVEPVSIPPISPTATDVLLDSTDAVPTEEIDPTSYQDSEPINPLGSSSIILQGSFLGISMRVDGWEAE
jgi:hypothetical protein